MKKAPLHLRGQTFHGRKGPVRNGFRYGVDYVLLDIGAGPADDPWLFSRGRPNWAAFYESDCGPYGLGQAGLAALLMEEGMAAPARWRLLTQPRVLGFGFNPVSFWLGQAEDGALTLVVAEVTNTYGDRHFYLCRAAAGGVITPHEWIRAAKMMHVSPFQPRAGRYRFRFDIGPARIGIWIDYDNGEGGGVFTNLTGVLAPLTTRGLLGAAWRRPLGPLRVWALIHWQALKLWRKGLRFRPRPEPLKPEISPRILSFSGSPSALAWFWA